MIAATQLDGVWGHGKPEDSQDDRTLIVLLSRQSIEILRKQHSLTGHGNYVFRAVSRAKGLLGLSPMNQGIAECRCQSRTDEYTRFSSDSAGHSQRITSCRCPLHQTTIGSLTPRFGRARDSTKFLPQRRRMMQRWADFLDSRVAARLECIRMTQLA